MHWSNEVLKTSFWLGHDENRVGQVPAPLFHALSQGSHGLMVESRTHNRKVASLSLGPAGIIGGGSECTALSLHLQHHDKVPLSKAPNPQLLPRRRSINDCPLLRVCVHVVCVFTAVCVHLDG